MVFVVAEIILTSLMKRAFSKIGFRLRALRRARHWTQESLASACQYHGFAVTRAKLAKYEIGLTEVPARFIPIFAHILKADIAELLPPIGRRPESGSKRARAADR